MAQSNNNFGYILFKIGNVGPEQIFFENLPPELDKNFKTISSIELGLYLSLVISQGKGMNKEGLFGPLPWYQLTEHELFLFSFLVKDPKTDDKRKKESTLCFLAIIFSRNKDNFLQAKFEIDKSLTEYLIKPKEKRLELTQETINYVIQTTKKVFEDAVNSGKKINQEKALDEVISYENMELFAIYSLKDKTLKNCLIGEESSLVPIEKLLKPNSLDQYQISVREDDKGGSSLILEFKELDTLIYVQLKQSLKSHKLINLLAKIDSSLEILSFYI